MKNFIAILILCFALIGCGVSEHRRYNVMKQDGEIVSVVAQNMRIDHGYLTFTDWYPPNWVMVATFPPGSYKHVEQGDN